MRNASSGTRGVSVIAALVAALLLSACASNGDLRALNRVAVSSIAALESTGAAYDAALNARMDLDARVPFETRESTPVTTAELAEADDRFTAYAGNVTTLRAHADLLAAYFRVISDYTAPGAKSGTKLTEAQIASARGVVSAFDRIDGDLDGVAPFVVSAVLTEQSAASLRAHLQDFGPQIADALILQEEAMQSFATHTRDMRGRVCNTNLRLFRQSHTTSRGSLVPAAEREPFITRRRAALNCTRGAAEADRAHAALLTARSAFVQFLGGDLAVSSSEDADYRNRVGARLAPVFSDAVPEEGDDGESR